MNNLQELKSKIVLLEHIVLPLLRYGQAKIGDKSVSLMQFNGDQQWIETVIFTRSSINQLACKFGKFADFKELVWQLYGNEKKRHAKLTFNNLLLKANTLFEAFSTCYPYTWAEPGEFVDTIDKVGLLLKKVVGVLDEANHKLDKNHKLTSTTMLYKKMLEDSTVIATANAKVAPDENGKKEETSQDAANGLNVNVTIGVLEKQVTIDGLTAAVFSLDYKEEVLEGIDSGNNAVQLPKPRKQRKYPEPPSSYHLKEWVREGVWPELKHWLLNDWYYKDEKVCDENLVINAKVKLGYPVSLLISLENKRLIKPVGKSGTYTAKQAVEIIKTTFGKHCGLETYKAHHKNKVGYTCVPITFSLKQKLPF